MGGKEKENKTTNNREKDKQGISGL